MPKIVVYSSKWNSTYFDVLFSLFPSRYLQGLFLSPQVICFPTSALKMQHSSLNAASYFCMPCMADIHFLKPSSYHMGPSVMRLFLDAPYLLSEVSAVRSTSASAQQQNCGLASDLEWQCAFWLALSSSFMAQALILTQVHRDILGSISIDILSMVT